MNKLRSFALPVVLVVAIMSGTLPQPACDGKKALSESAEAAKDIGGGTRDAIKAVRQAWEQKLITTEQKDKFADLLGAIARGGQKGVAAIDALEKSGVTELTADHRAQLDTLFSDGVITPFLEMITEIAKLSPTSSVAIRAAIATLRTAILLLSQKVGRNDVEKMILQRELQYA